MSDHQSAETAQVPQCYFCGHDAQPEHTPCCSSTFHNKPVCCEHYCRGHFVEVNKCSPLSHQAARAVSVLPPGGSQ